MSMTDREEKNQREHTMKYSIKIYGLWKTSWWKDESKKVCHKSIDEYSDLDEETFKSVLNDELDVPDYELTPENIKRNFGYSGSNETQISDACIERIIKYYSFRRDLYSKIIKVLIEDSASMSAAGITAVRFNLPPEGNNFSCEDASYDGGQIEAWIEVAMSEN